MIDFTNINEKYNFVWIAPQRTGSRSTARILSFCGFKSRGNPVCGTNNYDYTHNYNIPQKYDGYKIICNARNPYSRTVSLFKNYSYEEKVFNKETFKKYLDELTYETKKSKHKFEVFITPVLNIKPDYVIRLENFREDIMKLPFLFNHLTEEQVEQMCDHGKEIDEWESFYDQDMKDFVYKHLKHQFDMWGYEK